MASSHKLTSFLKHKRFYFIYPAILLFGTLINQLLAEDVLKQIKSSYVVSSKNSVNQLFAYQGNTIFLGLFLGLFVVRVLRQVFVNDLYIDLQVICSLQFLVSCLTLLKQFLVKFVFKYGFLLYLFRLIDYVFIETGGSCIVSVPVANALGSSSKDLETCSLYNGVWVHVEKGVCFVTPQRIKQIITSAEVCKEYGAWRGGFDVSGHFCFLITISLILWNELAILELPLIESIVDLENQSQAAIDFEKNDRNNTWFSFTVFNLWRWLIFLSLSIWIFLLTVTSIFYHTLWEKIVGLIFGYIAPLTIYSLIPLVPVLNELLF